MSAFLFRANPEWIRKLTDSELRQKEADLESFLAGVKWEKLKQCTFDFDQAYGRSGTLDMVKQEIKLRAEGRGDEPIKVPMVMGYNP